MIKMAINNKIRDIIIFLLCGMKYDILKIQVGAEDENIGLYRLNSMLSIACDAFFGYISK